MELVKSNTTGRTYNVANSIRIINHKQQMLYLKHGLTLLDIYYSIDYNTGKDLIVMVFDKKESYEAYQAWVNYELE